MIKILELAKFKDLDLWTDDRVFGYLLWPFNHPIPINRIRDEFSQLQKKYSTVNIFFTEDLLGEIHIKEDDSDFADKMGHQLVELGYRNAVQYCRQHEADLLWGGLNCGNILLRVKKEPGGKAGSRLIEKH